MYISYSKIEEERLLKWNQIILSFEATPNTINFGIYILQTSLQTWYTPSLCSALVENYIIAIKGKILEYQEVKKVMESLISLYGGDYLYGAKLFEGYLSLVKECSGIKE